MATISGVWVFVESPELSGYLPSGVLVNFTSNGQSYLGFECGFGPFDYITEIVYGGYNQSMYYDGGAWIDQAYRTIDFGTANQDVPEDFYSWFTANAIKQTPVVPTSKTLKEEVLKLRQNLDKIYEAGRIAGGGGGGGDDLETTYLIEEIQSMVDDLPSATDVFNNGKTAGIEEGKQVEYDRFWDAYQTSLDGIYNGAFRSYGWTDETYNPKYTIVCNKGHAEMAFTNAQITTTKVPIEIRVASAAMMFSNCSKLKTIPYIGFFGVTNTGSIFSGCYELENVTFGGEITTGFGFANCSKLTNASVQSYLDCLADLTGQTSQKVTFASAVGNQLTEAQKAAFTAKNYTVVY